VEINGVKDETRRPKRVQNAKGENRMTFLGVVQQVDRREKAKHGKMNSKKFGPQGVGKPPHQKR